MRGRPINRTIRVEGGAHSNGSEWVCLRTRAYTPRTNGKAERFIHRPCFGSGPTLGPTRPRRSAASSSAPMCSSIIASDHTRLAYGLEGENGRTWTTDLL